MIKGNQWDEEGILGDQEEEEGQEPGEGGGLSLFVPEHPTKEQLANLTHACVTELVARTKGMARAHLEVGMILAFIKDNRLFLSHGEGIRTFRDFLTDIDIGIGVSEATHLIRLWRKFGEYLAENNKTVSVRRLLLISPFCETPEEIDSWVSKAEILPEFAFQDELREAKGVPTQDACEHRIKELWSKCTRCGKWFRGSADLRPENIRTEESDGRGETTRGFRETQGRGNRSRPGQGQAQVRAQPADPGAAEAPNRQEGDA